MTLLLEEASYREFYKRYKQGNPFAIISAYQGTKTLDINRANTKSLRKKIFDNGYDQIKIVGKYIQDDYPLESMIVFSSPEREHEFIRFMIFFGKKYHQNCITIVDNNSNIWLYSTKQNSTIGAIGTKRLVSNNFQMFDIDVFIMNHLSRTFEIKEIKLVTD